MAFQQGLSGLNAASKALDVISNNVANSGNVGFKSGSTIFSDVYAAALNGSAGGVQIGIGTAVGGVTQLFSQGNITPTNNPLDIAINGNGFFQVQLGDGSVAYTRSGQFDINSEGFIVNSGGAALTGTLKTASGALPAPTNGNTVPLKLNTGDIAPRQSGNGETPPVPIRIQMNLDSREGAPQTATFDPTDPTSYNSSTAITIYDSRGNPRLLSLYFVSDGAGNFDINGTLDGVPTPAFSSPALSFTTAGTITGTTAHNLTLTIPGGSASPSQDIRIEFGGTTSYGSAFSVNSLQQDGYPPGKLTGITIGPDGVVQGRYSNGRTDDLARIALATFPSPNGLLSLGNNLWARSSESGPEIVSGPGEGNNGTLTAGAVEESNVDLTAELVNMITQQRAYQANAQSIRTQDQILQTLVNLR